MAVWRNCTIASMLCLSTFPLCSHGHELCKSVIDRVSDVDMTRTLMPGPANKDFTSVPVTAKPGARKPVLFYFSTGKLFWGSSFVRILN